MNELDLLQAEAAAADREIADNNEALLASANPDQAAAGAELVDDEAELRGIIELAAGMLLPVLPKTGAVAKAQAPAIAASGAEVMRMHGWTMGGFLSKYAPYIGLAVSVLPVVTVARAEIAEQRAAGAAHEQQPQPAA